MKKLLAAGAIGALAMNLAGCATVLNGTNQPVEFQSDPSGATARIIGGLTCETPCRVEMKRGKDSMVTFSREGYQSVDVYIQSRTGGGTFGNILAGGIVGGVVDGANGASNHLYPDPISVRLVRIGSTDEATLLDKKGVLISTVREYNARVAQDVREGLVEQGLMPANAPLPSGAGAN